MSKQPEALRLADKLEGDAQGIDLGAEGMGWGPSTSNMKEAAAELRRLYAEVDRLSYRLAYPDNFAREWVGLTDEEALTEAARHLGEMHIENCGLSDIKDFARAIEAKLKEKNT